MALIRLSTVHVNAQDADGQWSEHIELCSASSLQQHESSNMRVRNATGDRSIVTILPGGIETWSVGLGIATPDELAWLRKFRTKLCCFRDMDGNRVFGVYPDLSRDRFVWDRRYQLALDITGVSYDGGV